MDNEGRESGHLMHIMPERIFYAGLLGRTRERCVALKDGLRLSAADGRESYGELAVVPSNLRHTIASDYRSAVTLLIEPESVPVGTIEDFVWCLSGPEGERLARRIRATYKQLPFALNRDDIANTEFDLMCFGEALPQRSIDPRIARSIVEIGRFSGEPVTAARCAAVAGISSSRFLHLFKQETGTAFRDFRAWKRARHLLHFANADINFAHLAQEMGYPDSTHFSHSIRRVYGLTPRAIFSGSRELAIHRSRAVPALTLGI